MTELELRLQALAPEAFPPAPDVRAAVAARLAAASGEMSANATVGKRIAAGGGSRGSKRWSGPRFEPGSAERGDHGAPALRRRTLALAAVLVLVPTAAIAAVPGARHAVLDWLGLAHVRVERAPTAPRLPALYRADLGRHVASVAEAGRRAGFAIAVPRALGEPTAVYVSDGGIVALAYAAGPGLPRDAQTGLGLLVTELRATGVRDYVAKTAGPRTRIERVEVRGAPGVFISGEPHALLVELADRVVDTLPARLAGNTIAFERGDVVLRLEARFDRRHALALARSLRTSGP